MKEGSSGVLWHELVVFIVGKQAQTRLQNLSSSALYSFQSLFSTFSYSILSSVSTVFSTLSMAAVVQWLGWETVDLQTRVRFPSAASLSEYFYL